MKIILILIGVVIMVFGFGYLYHPDKISKLNNWVCENIFNDRMLLTKRRKAGVLLILLGTFIIYFVIR